MALELGLDGKVALITGGSEGLGRAIAERLATEGAQVAICARRQGPLDQAREEIKAATGQDILAVAADVTVPGDLERLVNTTIEQLGDIHILVNNAGRSAAQSLLTANDAYWQEDLDLKLMVTKGRRCRIERFSRLSSIRSSFHTCRNRFSARRARWFTATIRPSPAIERCL